MTTQSLSVPRDKIPQRQKQARRTLDQGNAPDDGTCMRSTEPGAQGLGITRPGARSACMHSAQCSVTSRLASGCWWDQERVGYLCLRGNSCSTKYR